MSAGSTVASVLKFTASFLMTGMVIVGAIAWTYSGGEARAIELVRTSKCPGPPGAALLLGVSTGTCGEVAEARAKLLSGTAERYRWRAHRFQGNRTGEWLVGYEDERGFGFHYVVDTTTGTVSDPDQDPFIAHRVGLLAEPANPFVKLEGVKAGLVRCSSGKVAGWCFEAQGVALNAGDPITFLDVEALVALRLGDRVYDGENRPQQPDPFSSVSQSRPWPSGERRSFHYKSRILPETLAESRGELLANLRITTETLSRARTAEYGLVQKISWNPDNLPE